MSIRIMTSVWDDGPDDKGELLVLLALADNANDDGYCWPSISYLSRKCRLSERGILDIEIRLESEGYLRIIRSSTDGKKNVNRYYINTEKLEENRKFREKNAPRVVNQLHHMVKPLHQGGEATSVKPSINLNNNNNIFTEYENEIGMLSPTVSDNLQEAEKTYPSDWIINAIKIAAKNNKRNWAYVDAILKNWKANGVGNYGKKKEAEYIPEDHATEVYQ